LRHHAKSAPQPQLHSTGDGRPLDCRDDRLVQLETRRPQRPAWNVATMALRTRRWDVEFAKRIFGIQRADVFEIPPGAERSARTVEHGNGGFLVGIEFKKSR